MAKVQDYHVGELIWDNSRGITFIFDEGYGEMYEPVYFPTKG